jgi:hypothetical protein
MRIYLFIAVLEKDFALVVSTKIEEVRKVFELQLLLEG